MDYTYRIGERWLTNEGYWVTIIEYYNALNCTIQFEDGVIMYNIKYSRFEKGTISKPKNRLGKTFINKDNCKFTIITYRSATDIDIQFEDGTILYSRQYRDAKLGTSKNPYHPSTYGRGYIGIGRHVTSINGKDTKMYTTWYAMFVRCYNESNPNTNPSYKHCSVSKKWYNFQVFGDWFEENWKDHMDSSWDLDKDILIKGNKIYSSETCCFVPKEINTVFPKCNKARGKYPIGVHKQGNRYIAQISNKRRPRNLGSFSTIEEAFQAYKIAKELWIKELADKWKLLITPQAYQALYAYEVEITD